MTTEENSLKKYIATRSGHKAYATKLSKDAGKLLERTMDNSIKLKTIVKGLEERLAIIETLDEKILEIILDTDLIEKTVVENCEYRFTIQEVIVRINDALEKLAVSEMDENTSISSYSKRKTQTAKLPKLVIKPFTGDILKFQEFWESYQSAVDDNEDLDKVTKFNYLKSLLQSNASSVISGLSLTADNYDEAVNLLRSRYGNKQVLISAHIDKLLSLPTVKSVNELQKLREVYDIIEINVRSLKSLDITSEHYGPILVSIVMSKLPEQVRLLMSRSMSNITSNGSEDVWKIDELLGMLQIEIESRELCCRMSSTSDEQRTKKEVNYHTASSLVTGANPGKAFDCLFCHQNHASHECRTITDITRRKEILRNQRRCFLCLKENHTARFCRSSYSCAKCMRRHNISICEPPPLEMDDKVKPKKVSIEVVNKNNSTTFLQTAKAIISGYCGEQSLCVRVLFDGGAQKSFITEKAFSQLNLKICRQERVIIKGFGENKEESMKLLNVVTLIVSDVFKKEVRRLEAYVVPVICSPISDQRIDLAQNQFNHLLNLKLADQNDSNADMHVDLLIGADFYWDFVSDERISGPSGPVAINTSLGWVLSGKMSSNTDSVQSMHISALKATVHQDDNDRMYTLTKKFWELDGIGITDSVEDKKDEQLMSEFKESIIFDGSRYTVSLPWKQGYDMLPDNFSLCKGRLKSLWNRLKNNHDLLYKYDDIIRDQLANGIIEVVDKNHCNTQLVHYIPHREIVREHKETSKVRIVYDASAKLRNHPSLNDCLEKGPSMMPKIFEILLRFRCFKYAIISDIKSAFLNIRVNENDRDFLRFLWFDDVKKSDPQLVILRFTSVMFGLTSSPFLLNATVSFHMNSYKGVYPDVIDTFLRDIYMDDSITGAQSRDGAIRFYTIAKKLMKDGGFLLRKWCTNDETLRNFIIESESEDDEETLDTVSKDIVKVLGIEWNVKDDEFLFSISTMIADAMEYKGIVTKRFILRIISNIFDPLGVLSPLVSRLKMILQDVFLSKLDWDDEVDAGIKTEWNRAIKGASELNVLKIPRFYLADNNLYEVDYLELHGFSDSSAKAYAAVVYMRIVLKNGKILTQFIASKTRVAPIKKLSIPRLELMSCLILSRLIKVILDSLVDFKFNNVYCWTDSQDALCWITSSDKIWKTFVQNRVTEIRKNVTKAEWNHCPGAINPADIPSRGLVITQPDRQEFWLKGPVFLVCSIKFWPGLNDSSVGNVITAGCLLELNSENSLKNLVDEKPSINTVINPVHFNSFKRLINVTCYVKRFVQNCKLSLINKQLLVEDIDEDYRHEIERMWIIIDQLSIDDKYFEQLKVSLGAYKDNGVIKLKGRLENSDLPHKTKFPTFIPRESIIGDLIIKDAHEKVMHSGIKDTLCEVRSKYWLCSGRERVRKILHKCILCRKYESKPLKMLPTPPLPEFRVKCCDPFTNCGTDYLGPLFVYPSPSGNDLHKVHVVLFTCATTRAIHLDLVSYLTSLAFVNCLKRFISRRGLPKFFISDNAKCFVGQELKNFTKKLNIQWDYIVEKSPWWGGFWERMVQVVKRPLRKVLRRTSVNYDELLTIITEIEGIVNCRPLCYMYSDNIEEVITPSHLIYGRRLISDHEISGEIKNLDVEQAKKRLAYLKTITTMYQKRWIHEYLTELREFHKSSQKDAKKGYKSWRHRLDRRR